MDTSRPIIQITTDQLQALRYHAAQCNWKRDDLLFHIWLPAIRDLTAHSVDRKPNEKVPVQDEIMGISAIGYEEKARPEMCGYDLMLENKVNDVYLVIGQDGKPKRIHAAELT